MKATNNAMEMTAARPASEAVFIQAAFLMAKLLM
jgi:hypothetical protein